MDIVECRLEVDGDHGVPLLLGHAEHQAVLGDSGVVDQNVDVAEVVLDFLDYLLGGREVGGVRRVTLAFHALGRDFLFGFLAVLVDDEVGESDVATFGSEFQSDFLADAAGGARDDGYFSFKKFHVFMFQCFV